MPSTIRVNVPPLRLPLVGMNGIDVLIDGMPSASPTFGEAVDISVIPGRKSVQVVTRGVVNRKSRALIIDVAPDQVVGFTAKYSRLWGKLTLDMP